MFLKKPPILILDAGMSTLDNINERKAHQAIASARAERTTILVAHRLTILRDADRILVFNDGLIVEVGPYDELIRQDGVIGKLVKSAEQQHG